MQEENVGSKKHVMKLKHGVVEGGERRWAGSLHAKSRGGPEQVEDTGPGRIHTSQWPNKGPGAAKGAMDEAGRGGDGGSRGLGSMGSGRPHGPGPGVWILS